MEPLLKMRLEGAAPFLGLADDEDVVDVAKIASGVIEVPKLAQLGVGRVALEKRLFLIRHAGGLLCLADEVEFGVKDPGHEYVPFEFWGVLQVAIGLLVERFQLYEN